MNLYAFNGAVLVPTIGRPRPTPTMLAIIAEQYPGREVVAVPGAVLAHGGGGVHCITQQIPAARHDRRPSSSPPTTCCRRRRGSIRRFATPIRVGLVQERWHADPAEHRDALARGVRIAAGEGRAARVPAGAHALAVLRDHARRPGRGGRRAGGASRRPDVRVRGRARGRDRRVRARVALRAGRRGGAGRRSGFNTAIVVAPDGALVARTRKVHLPVTAGYYEDRYFRPGDTGFPVVDLADARFGFPTCWDQWFPEVARSYALLGADVIVYPTAIGSEPDHPDFDTEPLWEQVIRANGIANGTFMVVPNRIGTEGPITFYGSSFISDPYGRVLVQAPRDRPAVLVADLDLDQRRDWLELFPFLATRRPERLRRARRAEPLEGGSAMTISERIDCMECGGHAHLGAAARSRDAGGGRRRAGVPVRRLQPALGRRGRRRRPHRRDD